MSGPGETEHTGNYKLFILQDSDTRAVALYKKQKQKQKQLHSWFEVPNMEFHLFSRFNTGRDFKFCPMKKQAVGTSQVHRCPRRFGLNQIRGRVP